MAVNSIISPRILSIQSHVVSGYCGNKSATFPLQLLEFEVDVLNTVQLSNHTQYRVATGQIFKNKDLEDIHSGLRSNKLLQLYCNVISGYVADVGYVESMSKLISNIKEERKQLGLDCLYTFDPVLGDDGVGFYVPGAIEVAEAYKRSLLPLADILTPNRFEASILSGVEIDNKSPKALEQCIKAMEVFHDMGVKIVIITSLMFASNDKELVCLLSYKSEETLLKDESVKNSKQQSESWIIRIPKLDCPFTGTGDLFSALFTGWLYKTGFNLKVSLEKTVNSVHEILEETFRWLQSQSDKSVHAFELRLIQNRNLILSPGDKLKAQEFHS